MSSSHLSIRDNISILIGSNIFLQWKHFPRERKEKKRKENRFSLSLYDSIRFCFHSKLIDDATYESYLERITNKSCKYTDSTTTLFDDTTTTNVNSEIISQSIDEFIR